MHVRVEAWRGRAAELVEERLAIAAVPDVLAHLHGFGAIEHHQEVAAAVARRACDAVACVSSWRYLP
jgi:hypothetical protein